MEGIYNYIRLLIPQKAARNVPTIHDKPKVYSLQIELSRQEAFSELFRGFIGDNVYVERKADKGDVLPVMSKKKHRYLPFLGSYSLRCESNIKYLPRNALSTRTFPTTGKPHTRFDEEG